MTGRKLDLDRGPAATAPTRAAAPSPTAHRLERLLEAIERLPPERRLVAAVDVIDALERVRTIRAGAILDLRLGDGAVPGLTWAAVGDLVGQSRQVVEQWARQYQRAEGTE